MVKIIIVLVSLIFLGIVMVLPESNKAQVPGPTVTVQNSQFSPQTISIAPGSTVTWVNNDSLSHSTISDDMNAAESWNSGQLAQGQSFSKTFNQAGTYTYHCGIHPEMKGIVQVVADKGTIVVPAVTVAPTPTPVPTTALPRTGAPLPIYLALAGLISLSGLKIINFSRVIDGSGQPQTMWKRRQLKLP